MRQVLDPVRAARAHHALLREACRLRVADRDLLGALNRLCRLAARGVAGVDDVSVVIGPPGEPDVTASSSPAAQSADGLQHLACSGPTFDAFDTGTGVATEQLFADPRWPRLRRGPVALRFVHRAFAVPLVGEDGPGVVTFYAGPGTVVDRDTAEQALTFATVAAGLVQEHRAVARLFEEIDQLRDGLTSRAVIDQAKGMVMLAQRCDADQAFAVLQRLSSTSGRKIRDVAQDVVSTRPPARASQAKGRRARRTPG